MNRHITKSVSTPRKWWTGVGGSWMVITEIYWEFTGCNETSWCNRLPGENLRQRKMIKDDSPDAGIAWCGSIVLPFGPIGPGQADTGEDMIDYDMMWTRGHLTGWSFLCQNTHMMMMMNLCCSSSRQWVGEDGGRRGRRINLIIFPLWILWRARIAAQQFLLALSRPAVVARGLNLFGRV